MKLSRVSVLAMTAVLLIAALGALVPARAAQPSRRRASAARVNRCGALRPDSGEACHAEPVATSTVQLTGTAAPGAAVTTGEPNNLAGLALALDLPAAVQTRPPEGAVSPVLQFDRGHRSLGGPRILRGRAPPLA